MNKRLSISAVSLLMLLCFSSWAQALSIGFSISDTDITAGENFSVDVTASGASLADDEILAFGFDVFVTNLSIVNFVSAVIGPSFEDFSAFFLDTDVVGVAFPGLTDDSLLLATLNFTALGPGDVTLGILSDLIDLNEGLIYLWAGAQDISASFGLKVSDAAAPVPEPASIFLFATGILGIAGLARKRSAR
jgi:hypothetical protein